MSSGPRFGQGSPVKAYVEPQVGRAGTPFRFKAIHLDPSSRAEVSITAPERKRLLLVSTSKHVYNGSLTVDRSGNISIELMAKQDWLPGTYTFVVTGIYNGRKVAAEAFFDLTA